MRGKQWFYRAFAKHRAGRYAGKKNRTKGEVKKRKVCGLVFLAVALGVLYGKELPLFYFPQEGYAVLGKLAETENREAGDNALPVRYAEASETFLEISHTEGNIPEYISVQTTSCFLIQKRCLVKFYTATPPPCM